MHIIHLVINARQSERQPSILTVNNHLLRGGVLVDEAGDLALVITGEFRRDARKPECAEHRGWICGCLVAEIDAILERTERLRFAALRYPLVDLLVLVVEPLNFQSVFVLRRLEVAIQDYFVLCAILNRRRHFQIQDLQFTVSLKYKTKQIKNVILN